MKSRLAIAVLIAAIGTWLVPATATAQQINTFSGWNGTDEADDFGAPNTATYGQTFKATGSSLTDFSFWLSNYENGGALQFSAYLASWDGSEIGSILWSSPGTYLGTSGSAFTQYLFGTGGVAVTPGQMYVAFLNASPFIASNPLATAEVEFGADHGNPYAGGAYVFTNNGDAFSLLTSPWDQRGDDSFYGNGFDLAFVANFNGAVPTVPEPASMTLLATGLVGMAAAARRKKQRTIG